jgi:hypothetical protein
MLAPNHRGITEGNELALIARFDRSVRNSH